MSVQSAADLIVEAVYGRVLTRLSERGRGRRGTVTAVDGASATVLIDGDAEPTLVELIDSGARGIRAGDRCLVVSEGRTAHIESYVLTEDRM